MEVNLSHWKVDAQIQGCIAQLSEHINIVHPEDGSGTRNSGGLSSLALFSSSRRLFAGGHKSHKSNYPLIRQAPLLSAEDYLLFAFVFTLSLSPITCPRVELRGRVIRVLRCTPAVGKRTGLCRSVTNVCVIGQGLSLKLSTLGSGRAQGRQEHGTSWNLCHSSLHPTSQSHSSLRVPATGLALWPLFQDAILFSSGASLSGFILPFMSPISLPLSLTGMLHP